MTILEVTNQQWNCVPLRIEKNLTIQHRILAEWAQGAVSPHTDAGYGTYYKRMGRQMKYVDIVSVYAGKSHHR